MDPSEPVVVDATKQETESTAATSEAKTENVRPEYQGDKGDFTINLERNTPVERKTVATFSFGKRVRIAALATPQYE